MHNIAKRNRQTAKDMSAVAFIADNSSKKEKEHKIENNSHLKKERYVVKQFNEHELIFKELLDQTKKSSLKKRQ
jgi:hypothetical protein